MVRDAIIEDVKTDNVVGKVSIKDDNEISGNRSPTFGSENKVSKDVFKNRDSSLKLRNLISKGKLPEYLLEQLDLDRICEQEENFLDTDRK